jgi:hypothetical protein
MKIRIAKIETAFDLGDKVAVDKSDIIGVITSISITHHGKPNNEVTWFHNGEIKTTWCYDWRLEKA